MLTDPSYYGQIVTMTYPLIGNYGINEEDFQSYRPHVRGFVVREACEKPSNFRCKYTLDEYLKANGIVGIQGVDTRAITKVIREKGTMMAMITSEITDIGKKLSFLKDYIEKDHVKCVTAKEVYRIPGKGPKVAVVDYGIKANIIESLKLKGADITVFPATSKASDIMSISPEGVLLSNGPGDPKDADYAVTEVKKIIGKVPIFGICLGHQILSLALGCDTAKLKYGHRGCNHPVKDLRNGRTYITSQNHGYAVVPESLPEEVEITHLNANDGTIEGIRHRKLPMYSVQFHPEASPGPCDTSFLFDEFINMVKEEGSICTEK